MNIRERMLSHPAVYTAFKRLVLSRSGYARIFDTYLAVPNGTRVLDLGCGYGDAAPFFLKNGSYVGVDHNPSYIDVARKLNAGTTANFLVGDVSDPEVGRLGPFDAVIMVGVLHHMSSAAIADLMGLVTKVLTDTGRFMAIEPVFEPEQSLAARLAIAADRGRFVRDEEGYKACLSGAFSELNTSIVRGMLRIPYSHVIVVASTPKRSSV